MGEGLIFPGAQTLGLHHASPHQGPFVHLSVMISAYLGRVRAKAVGDTEVRETRKSSFETRRGTELVLKPGFCFSPEQSQGS